MPPHWFPVLDRAGVSLSSARAKNDPSRHPHTRVGGFGFTRSRSRRRRRRERRRRSRCGRACAQIPRQASDCACFRPVARSRCARKQSCCVQCDCSATSRCDETRASNHVASNVIALQRSDATKHRLQPVGDRCNHGHMMTHGVAEIARDPRRRASVKDRCAGAPTPDACFVRRRATRTRDARWCRACLPRHARGHASLPHD